MKRLLGCMIIALLAVVVMFALAACAQGCQHTEVTQTVEREAQALMEGTMRFTCNQCGNSRTEEIPATKSVKILAIGNSFSMDCVEYLWDICKSGGVENIVIGHLYYGGCSLDGHWQFMQTGSGAYTYYENSDGQWITYPGYQATAAMAREDWDYIVVQQVSGSSGMPDTYENLDKILHFIETRKTNPNAKILWNMTWAYQANSTHPDFSKYNRDQMTMYNAIVDTVETKILTNDRIAGVIPAGTAIQNLRTSYVGDTMTVDGYHLNHSHGRYTAALAWYAAITGGSPDDVTWFPSGHTSLSNHFTVISEAVRNAIETPYAVTESEYPVKNS